MNMNFFKKIKNNNKGLILYNRVLCYWILIMVLFFGVDVCIYFAQGVVTSYQTAYFAEKISVQGGLLGAERVLPGKINGTYEHNGVTYVKTCTSCYTNEDISLKMNKTMSRFGVSPNEWSMILYDSNNGEARIHVNGVTQDPTEKLRLEYMSINQLEVTSKFKPKVSAWLWTGTEFKKRITFISEYIPR